MSPSSYLLPSIADTLSNPNYFRFNRVISYFIIERYLVVIISFTDLRTNKEDIIVNLLFIKYLLA